ncbi:hypothetical protein XENTR_v10019388 [Xenopus tropicalis]|nr:hypothetical protein XENTR_v10019388 [Xenopus tropicalis]
MMHWCSRNTSVIDTSTVTICEKYIYHKMEYQCHLQYMKKPHWLFKAINIRKLAFFSRNGGNQQATFRHSLLYSL